VTGVKIVIFHPSDELYGSDRVLLETVQALRPHCEVEVLLPRDVIDGVPGPGLLATRLARLGAHVRYVPWPVLRRRYLASPRGWCRLLGEALRSLMTVRSSTRDAGLVVLSTTASLLVRPLLLGRPILSHVQEVWTRGSRLFLGPLLCGTQVVAISEFVSSALPKRAARRAVRLWNAVPDPGVAPATRSGCLRLVVTGRWTQGKGQLSLLEALALVERRDLHLTVLGSSPRLGRGLDLNAVVSAHPCSGRIDLVGEVEDVVPYLQAADIVVVPSAVQEGLGLAAIEGLAAGRAVIASSAGGLPEVVTSDCGWIYSPNSPEALAGLLEEITWDAASAKGRAGRVRYEQHFAVDAYRGSIRRLMLDSSQEHA
jgi:glycosyltransferase involved in cell wall biosynthesis